MKILPSFIRRGMIGVGKNYFAKHAIARREELSEQPWDASLHMVVGHSMLHMGLLALRSFEFHTRYRWSPWIHDDGSLDEKDIQTLERYFPDATVVRRKVANEEVPAAQVDFPCCRQHRMNHNWFLKVFDTRHYAPKERYILLDSDIVFFQPPDEILDWLKSGSEEMFVMEDDREKYSHSRHDLEKLLGMHIVPKANSGLDLMTKENADLQLAENFLELCAETATQYEFLEQTIFGLWVSAAKGALLPKERYEISWNNFRRPGTVCRHYIGSAKNDALYVEGATTFWWQSCVKERRRAYA